jgi:glutamate decarboxylase
MEDLNFRKGDAKTEVFGSNRMLQPSPVEKIPDGPTTPEIAYQMVKDETFAQTQPRLNLATFVTTYMDEYATKLMNEAININYIDETEYPRIAVMNGKCINIVANLWNSPEKETWKTGALAIGSSAGWCGSLVALAQETSGTRQTVRQTQLRYFNRFPGGMGKIRPIVAD